MGFRSLRVINEDYIAAGAGFGTHPHKDMEIITVVLKGELAHRDSMNHEQTIRPGEVQHMTAGTGVTHSEYNHSEEEEVHLLQIWILPEKPGLPPAYGQKDFSEQLKPGNAVLLASHDGRDGSLKVNQDFSLYRAVLEDGSVAVPIESGRHAWVQVMTGSVDVNGSLLKAGDGAAVSGETLLRLTAQGPSDSLVFDLN
jgi:redox-sensitive bicupin YhaK (pirin superfamily)